MPSFFTMTAGARPTTAVTLLLGSCVSPGEGKIGSTGGSALGIVQNMTAPGVPAELQAQYVAVAFSDMYRQGAYQGGAFRRGLLKDWLKATGMSDENLKAFAAHPRSDEF